MASGEKTVFENKNIDFKVLSKVFKDENCLKLFRSYVKQVNSKENQNHFEEEVEKYEKERGFDVSFLHPSPGLALLAEAEKGIAFINLAVDSLVEKPQFQFGRGSFGAKLFLPHALLSPRWEINFLTFKSWVLKDSCKSYDKVLSKLESEKGAFVYDVIFNPLCFENCNDKEIFTHLVKTAVESIKVKSNVNLTNVEFLAFDLYIGHFTIALIKKKTNASQRDENFDSIESLIKDSSFESTKAVNNNQVQIVKKDEIDFVLPTYELKYVNYVGVENYSDFYNKLSPISLRPKVMRISINLNKIKSAELIDVDVFQKQFALKTRGNVRYQLNLVFSYAVEEEPKSAKFDVSNSILKIEFFLSQSFKDTTKALISTPTECLNNEEINEFIVSQNKASDLPENSNSEMKEHLKDNFDLTTLHDDNFEETNNKQITSSIPCDKSADTDYDSGYGTSPSSDKNKSEINLDFGNLFDEVCTDEGFIDESDCLKEISASKLTPKTLLPQCHFEQSQAYLFIYVKIDFKIENINITILDSKTFQFYYKSIGSGLAPLAYKGTVCLAPFPFKNKGITHSFEDSNFLIKVEKKKSCLLKKLRYGMHQRNLQTVKLNAEDEITFLSQCDAGQKLERSFSVNDIKSSESENEFLATKNKNRCFITASWPRGILKPRSRSFSDSFLSDDCSSATPIHLEENFSNEIFESETDDHAYFSGKLVEPEPNVESCSLTQENSIKKCVKLTEPEPNVEACSLTRENSIKKCVRFNEFVSKQVFSRNASIVDRPSRNQKKLKNKKMTRERKLSEGSQSSENENESKPQSADAQTQKRKKKTKSSKKPTLKFSNDMMFLLDNDE